MINKFKYQIDLAYPRSIDLPLMHGESIELDIVITINGEPWTSTSNTIEMLWQDPSMGDSWYTTTASRIGSTVTVNWKGSMDTGAELYRWFIRLKGPGDDQSYRVYGKLRMQKSPGFVPNQLPKPTSTLDFNSFEVVNAPYYTKVWIDSELAKIAEDIEALKKEVGGDSDELISQHTKNMNNPHNVTVGQLAKNIGKGLLLVAWGGTEDSIEEYFYFNFDPKVFNQGSASTSIRIPSSVYLHGTDLGGEIIEHSGNFERYEGSNDNWGGNCYVSTDTISIKGLDLYIYLMANPISIQQQDDIAIPAWVGVGLTRDPFDYANTSEITTITFSGEYNPKIKRTQYDLGGVYRILTEELLRDKTTGTTYTLSVDNGELHLIPYTIQGV